MYKKHALEIAWIKQNYSIANATTHLFYFLLLFTPSTFIIILHGGVLQMCVLKKSAHMEI